MFELLCERAAATPERAVAITFDRCISYAGLVSRARIVAQRLRGSGVRRGDRVGLLCDNCIEWLEVFFAAAAIGAILVPFSTWSTAREIDFLVSDSKVRFLFTIHRFGEHGFAEDIAALRHNTAHQGLERIILIGAPPREGFEAYAMYGEGESLPSLAPGEGASAADPLVILYTRARAAVPKQSRSITSASSRTDSTSASARGSCWAIACSSPFRCSGPMAPSTPSRPR